MLGNVQEWVDGGESGALPLPGGVDGDDGLALVDPVDTERGGFSAMGGGFNGGSQQTSLISEHRPGSANRTAYTGFRLVRTADTAGLAPPQITDVRLAMPAAAQVEATRFPRFEGLPNAGEVAIEASVRPGAADRPLLGGSLYLVTPDRSRFKLGDFSPVDDGDAWRVTFQMSDVVTCFRARVGGASCGFSSLIPPLKAQFFDAAGYIDRVEIEAEIACPTREEAGMGACLLDRY